MTNSILTLNEQIEAINKNKLLTTGDRKAAFDALLGTSSVVLPDLYKVEEIVLPGRLRAIAVASATIAQNAMLQAIHHWPLLEIFDVDDTLPGAETCWVHRPSVPDDEYHGDVVVVRHVEILGPSRVVHDPTQPLEGNPRRASVMVTEAPLRLWVDTLEQSKIVGTGHESHNPHNTSGRFGC